MLGLQLPKRRLTVFTTLLCVLVFWIGGAAGCWKFLYDAHTPVTTLAGLYLMLGLFFASIMAAAISVYSLWRRRGGAVSLDVR